MENQPKGLKELVALQPYISKDKEFVALRLKQYAQIDYQPVSEVRFLQGEAAKQAAKVFSF